MSKKYLATIFGKAVKKAAKLRGGGSALPGLVAEKIDPNFVSKILSTLPLGIVIISGTNGKTTTTKIVVELLESTGLKVFTNKTGSNFSRGVAAALLGEMKMSTKLNADIAVLELDEAHAVHFVKKIKPNYSLLLNVMRDQLDRFGEIDTTAKMLEQIALSTKKTVVFNRDDRRIYDISKKTTEANSIFFGTTSELLKLMPTDDSLKSGDAIANDSVDAAVKLMKIEDGNKATFQVGKEEFSTTLKLNGVYNVLNSAAALALASQIIKDSNQEKCDFKKLLSKLAQIQPAFGRGEAIIVNGAKTELILVKNPSGFRLAIKSFANEESSIMIAINDSYADGRDVSWLWDVDFSSFRKSKIDMVSGSRAYDMALRLKYDEVEIGEINDELIPALNQFITQKNESAKLIFCTYTCMTAIRKELAKIAEVEQIS